MHAIKIWSSPSRDENLFEKEKKRLLRFQIYQLFPAKELPIGGAERENTRRLA
ncbi:hypothetical protein [Rhizobium oryziradicis]|uniref:hypothetical protein n=1 Tax=Rhizobium oryziradicis TaxID=1867956 RepID=UPI000B095FB4|nr:hypothetical protein [Rhizobium oryziradicis]